MATQEQIRANQQNAQKSTGPTSEAGRETCSQNAFKHGLSGGKYHNELMHFLPDENVDKYYDLVRSLIDEHEPETPTEMLFIRNMAKHEWLRARAIRFQQACFLENTHILALPHFNAYMRYETIHERGFIKCLHELQKLRKERKNGEIGSVSQKPPKTAAAGASQPGNMGQNVVLPEKEFNNLREMTPQSPVDADPSPEASPGSAEIAA